MIFFFGASGNFGAPNNTSILLWIAVSGHGHAYTGTAQKNRTFSFFSIFVSSCAFALTLAIMQGFEDATYSKMKGVHADIYVQAPAGQSFDTKTIAPVLTAEFPEVTAFTGYRYGQGLLIADETSED